MRAVGVVAALACVVALGGCGSDEPAASPTSSPSASPAAGASTSTPPSAEPSSYLPVPDGVVLTEQGADLAAGSPATVAWEPRQKTVGVLDVTVSGLERTSLRRSFVGWQIPEATRTATPYFVRATVTNRGESDLGGRNLPLYAVDGAGTLVEATTFASRFRPCRPGAIPDSFAPGASAEMCLVYFLPEGSEMTAVSFRPGEAFNPITWTGEITRAPRTRTGGGNDDDNGGAATD